MPAKNYHGLVSNSLRKQNGRGPFYKRDQYPNLTTELGEAGYKAVGMRVEIGDREFIGSSVYNLLTKLSI